MGLRSDLHELLVSILGTRNVYFQPPPSVMMSYPCIVYNRDRRLVNHADDIPYKQTVRYQVKVIDQDPDSDIPGKVAQLPMCSFERWYAAGELNHDVFNLYF